MIDIAIVAGYVLVGLMTYWYSYQFFRARQLLFVQGRPLQEAPARYPPFLTIVGFALPVLVGIRVGAATSNPLLGLLAVLLAGVVERLVNYLCATAGLTAWTVRFTAASDDERGRLLGFTSVEEMRRSEAAGLGYSSVEDMREHEEATHAHMRRWAEVNEQVPRMASSGVPIERAIEEFGVEHATAIEYWYRQAEESGIADPQLPEPAKPSQHTSPSGIDLRAAALGVEHAGDIIEFGEEGIAVIRRQLEREFRSSTVDATWDRLSTIIWAAAKETMGA